MFVFCLSSLSFVTQEQGAFIRKLDWEVTRGKKELTSKKSSGLSTNVMQLIKTHLGLVEEFTAGAKTHQQEVNLLMESTSIEIASFVKLQQLMKLVCEIKSSNESNPVQEEVLTSKKKEGDEEISHKVPSQTLGKKLSGQNRTSLIVRKGSSEKLGSQIRPKEPRPEMLNQHQKYHSPTRMYDETSPTADEIGDTERPRQRDSLDIPPTAIPTFPSVGSAQSAPVITRRARAPKAKAIRNTIN